MAEFNPELREKDANYLGYSRGTDRAMSASIDQLPNLKEVDFGTQKADTSAGELLADVAKIGAGSIKFVDELIQTTATEQLRQGVEKIRGQFTSDLNTAIGGVGTGTPPVLASGGDDEDGSDIPNEVQGVDRRVKQLASARAAGKLTEAGYWLQLDNFARSMRERYPGHKDFIDQKIAAYTGGNPANQLWRSQLSALQALAANAAKSGGDNDKYIRQNASLLDQDLRDALYSGDPSKRPADNVMLLSIANNKAKKDKLETESLDLTVRDKQNTLETRHVQQYGENLLKSAADDVLSGLLKSEQGAEMIKNIKAGEVLTGEQAKQANSSYAAFEQQVRFKLNEIADRGVYSKKVAKEDGTVETVYYGPSLRSKLGSDYNSIVDRAMGNLTVIRDQLYDKNYGVIPFMKTWNDVSQDSRIRQMQEQYPAFRILGDINKVGGPTAVQMTMTQGKLLGPVQSAIDMVLQGRTANGDAINSRDQINYLKQQGFNEKDSPDVFQRVFEGPIATIQNKDQPFEIKLQNARQLFNDTSLDSIAKLSKNSQQVLFDKLTSKQFTESMSVFKNKDIMTWSSYVKFIKDHFVPLYRDEVSRLAESRESWYASFGFDAKSRQFVELPRTPTQEKLYRERRYSGADTRTQSLQGTATRLNNAIQQILPILQANNPNLIDYELKILLGAMGINLIKPAATKTEDKQ